MAATQAISTKLQYAHRLPFLSHRFIGLDEAWLTVIGFRLGHETKHTTGGLSMACAAAENVLKLSPDTTRHWTIEDLYRVFCTTSLADIWAEHSAVNWHEQRCKNLCEN